MRSKTICRVNASALAGIFRRERSTRSCSSSSNTEKAAGRLTLSAESPHSRRLVDQECAASDRCSAARPACVALAYSIAARSFSLAPSPRENRCRVVLARGSDALRCFGASRGSLVTNQFTAMGSLKPGLVRLLDTDGYSLDRRLRARDISFTRGRLARMRTIHFARWVFLDGKKRMVFFSNYDGTVESYMDDFINKTGFGLNAVFSNGIGYPRTNWLVLDGCHDERKFKNFLRRHTLPTQVWYKAYPGLTAIDLERNRRIREGLESSSINDRMRANGLPFYEPGAVDYSDVQGLVRFGYGKMTEAAYAHLRVKDVAAARPGCERPRHQRRHDDSASIDRDAGCVHGRWPGGTRRTGVHYRRFSSEFLTGMTEESRSRRSGDIGNNAPSKWEWGYAASVPHLMVMFFAEPRPTPGLHPGGQGKCVGGGVRGDALARDGRSRRGRAVRFRRRHQPAADRLGTAT